MVVENKIIDAMDNLLCRKWTLKLLIDLQKNSPRRFNKLAYSFPGISTKTLSERLKALEKEGIVKRKSFEEIPPRVEYSLTEKGGELIKSFGGIIEWAKKWM